MKIISEHKLWSYSPKSTCANIMTCSSVRKNEAHRVHSYTELATKIAELQFLNQDSVLLFRGQTGDYRNSQNYTTLKPTIFRSRQGTKKNPSPEELDKRFRRLNAAERALVECYEHRRFIGQERLRRHHILRWSILQHYEVCSTPLMDVTQSLRIAASFASLDATKEAYIFVVGVPHLSGAITVTAEAGLQIIRLASVCPPSATRPHIQEGYLIGEYPDIFGVEQKERYKHYEVDCARRLVAKFCFDPNEFWKDPVFPRIDKTALYPSSSIDLLYQVALEVKGIIGPE